MALIFLDGNASQPWNIFQGIPSHRFLKALWCPSRTGSQLQTCRVCSSQALALLLSRTRGTTSYTSAMAAFLPSCLQVVCIDCIDVYRIWIAPYFPIFSDSCPSFGVAHVTWDTSILETRFMWSVFGATTWNHAKHLIGDCDCDWYRRSNAVLKKMNSARRRQLLIVQIWTHSKVAKDSTPKPVNEVRPIQLENMLFLLTVWRFDERFLPGQWAPRHRMLCSSLLGQT